MKYGCIGEHLSHSFSKEIHAHLASYEYELCEVAKSDLSAFLTAKDFLAINVTIPYKQDVIPYLDQISKEAQAIGAVNTIVNRGGKLYGCNTDFYGICAALSQMRFSRLDGKKVLILGTGGTSRTARAVAEHLGAKEICRVSRSGNDGAITYEEMLAHHTDADFIFNTTPVGMYPNTAQSPIDLTPFQNLSGVFDAVYNPLRTRFVTEAAARGIPASCGLYMLAAQAFRAAEIFLDTVLDPALLPFTYEKIKASKENLVLIGMPSCGKSTVGKALAAATGRAFFDSDEEIVRMTGKSIPAIFNDEGEAAFRAIEADAIASLSLKTGVVIATGGGAVLREDNVENLKQNGKLIFLDRPLSDLLPTPDRPLARDAQTVQKLYAERIDRYRAVADVIFSHPKRGVLAEADAIRKELSL